MMEKSKSKIINNNGVVVVAQKFLIERAMLMPQEVGVTMLKLILYKVLNITI